MFTRGSMKLTAYKLFQYQQYTHSQTLYTLVNEPILAASVNLRQSRLFSIYYPPETGSVVIEQSGKLLN